MIRVSLSDAEKSIESIWLWYQKSSAVMRGRLVEEQTAIATLPRMHFLGMTSEEVAEFFLELDYLSMLDLLSASEAAIRVDFWTRVHNKEKDPLSRVFRRFAKEREEKIAFEEQILDAWAQQRPKAKSSISDFRAALKLRHWLAHGRYWVPKLARKSYSPGDVFDICDALLSELSLK